MSKKEASRGGTSQAGAMTALMQGSGGKIAQAAMRLAKWRKRCTSGTRGDGFAVDEKNDAKTHAETWSCSPGYPQDSVALPLACRAVCRTCLRNQIRM